MRKHNSFIEKKELKRQILRASAILLAIILVITAALLVLKKWEKRQQSSGTVGKPQISEQIRTYKGKEYKQKRNVDTFLVMGLDEISTDIVYDEDAINNNQEADFLILFVFDNNKRTYSALHINRDAMAKMDIFGAKGDVVGSKVQQLALAHTYGDGKRESCKNTVKAVEGLLNNDVNIESYISVPMDSVAEINDIVGGVEVTVLQDLTYADAELYEGATVTLEGDQALTYVRTRYGLDNSSNEARMQRQKQYLEKLFDAINTKLEVDDEIVDTLMDSNTFKTIEANNINTIESVFRKLPEYEFCGIYSLEGDYQTAQNDKGEINMEFYPYDDSVEESVINLLYNPSEND